MTDRIDKLKAIHHINESILTILDMSKLLKRVLHIMEDTFGFDAAAVLLSDEKSGEFYIRAATGYNQEMIRSFRTSIGGQGITGHVAETKQPLYVHNIHEDSRYVAGVNDAKSEIAIPLLVNGEHLIGILDVESKQECLFTNDDFEALCLFGSHLALALHNALIFEKERRKASQLMVIHKIRQRLSKDLELEKLLHIVTRSMIEFFSYYQVLVFVFQESEQSLQLMSQSGLEELSPSADILANMDQSIIGEAFAQNSVVLVKSLQTNPFKEALFEDAQSELALPIALDDTAIGVIYIASLSQNAFDKKDTHFLKVISEQLSALIKDAADLSTISKKNKQIEVIHKIGQVAIQSFDLKQFLDDIVSLIHEIFGYYHVAFFTYESLSQQLELVSYTGEAMQTLAVGDKFSAKEGITGFVVRSGKYCLCNDTTKDPHYIEEILSTKSELALPIIFNNKVLGVLDIESPKLSQFDATDLEIFSEIADQVAYTVVNAELYQQKTSAHNLLLNLNSLGREIYATFDMKKILATVIEKLPLYVKCRLCSIFFYTQEKNQLKLMAHNLPGLQDRETFSVSASDNMLMNRVITLSRSLHVLDVEKEFGIPKRPQYETKSFLNILLRHHDRVIGILNLTDKIDLSPFSTEEFYLIHSFSEHLSNAIINAEKYQEILELSITDGLTGLFVHRFFQETLEKEVSRAQRSQIPLSLILLDFDDFKQCNDHYGHQVGDIVLRETAVLIRKQIREYDIACRYGGEEFSIILPSTPIKHAKIVAERLKDKIAAHTIEMGKHVINITVSQGVSEYDAKMDKNAFIKQADMALLRAKRQGKNKVMLYEG